MTSPDNDSTNAPLLQSLDREAARVRAEPDAGFEARVLRAALRAEAPSPVVARLGFWRTGAFRAAAAVALLLTVGAVSVVALRPDQHAALPSATSSDVLDDIDQWLGVDENLFGRANLASFREELDSADHGVSFDDVGQTSINAEDWM